VSEYDTKSPADLRRGPSCSQRLPQMYAEVSTATKFDLPNSQSDSIRNAPPLLRVHSEAPGNALVESDGTSQSFRGAWEHLKILRTTGEGYWSLSEVWVWLRDWGTFCWCCSACIVDSSLYCSLYIVVLHSICLGTIIVLGRSYWYLFHHPPLWKLLLPQYLIRYGYFKCHVHLFEFIQY